MLERQVLGGMKVYLLQRVAGNPEPLSDARAQDQLIEQGKYLTSPITSKTVDIDTHLSYQQMIN